MIVTKEVAKVLATLTGQEELVEIIEKEGEEKVEMYSLWKDAIHIGMEDGRKKGKEENDDHHSRGGHCLYCSSRRHLAVQDCERRSSS